MAFITSEAEETIRGVRSHTLRDMRRNIRPFVCSFQEDAVRGFVGRPNGSGSTLPSLPREDRAQRTRADVPDDHEPDWLEGTATVTPTPIDIQTFDTCCQMAYTLGQTDERLRRIRQITGEK